MKLHNMYKESQNFWNFYEEDERAAIGTFLKKYKKIF